MKQLVLIAPELFLSALALGLLVGEAFGSAKSKIWLKIGVAGLILAGLHQIAFFITGAYPGAEALGVMPAATQGGWVQYNTAFGMLATDSLAAFFKLLVIISVLFTMWLSTGYREFEDVPMGTYVALLLLSTVGMLFLVSAVDL